MNFELLIFELPQKSKCDFRFIIALRVINYQNKAKNTESFLVVKNFAIEFTNVYACLLGILKEELVSLFLLQIWSDRCQW